MNELVVKKSNPNKPPRILIYGVEGVGKSTLGARAPKPIFISPEGGTDELKNAHGNGVDQIPNIKTWLDVKNAIKSLATLNHDYQTVVLDSADWIEKVCHLHILGTSGKSITTVNGGYGSGYRESEAMHKVLIDDLSELREKKNMGIIITAHAHVKAVKDPSMMEDYDSFEIKCHEMVSSLWREWVDALLFARFRTFLKSNDDSSKARALGDGTRVVYTQKQPAFQAKNRYGLPVEMEFTENFWNEFITLSGKGPKDAAVILSELTGMVEGLTDLELKEKVLIAMKDANGDAHKLNSIHNRLKTIKRG